MTAQISIPTAATAATIILAMPAGVIWSQATSAQ